MASKHAKTAAQKKTTQRATGEAEASSPAPRMGASVSDTLLSQTFIELAPDAMLVIDSAGRIVQLNHQTEVIFGYARPLLLGQTIERLLPGRFHRVHRGHRTDYFSEPHTRPMGANLSLFGQRQDGSEFPVEVSLSPVHFGDEILVICSIRDITERRRLEAAERAAHAAAERERLLLQTLLDELPGGAYLVRGPEAQLVLANRAAEQVWGAHWPVGTPMAEFVRTSGLRYFAENGEPIAAENLLTRRILRDGIEIHQTRQVIRRRDGAYLPTLLSAVDVEPSLLGVPAEAQAVERLAETPAPAAEPQRVALVLLQDISAIQAAEHLKDEFVSLAAHELRTPLAGLLGFSSMLRVQTANGHGPALSDWQEEAIVEIETAANRLNELVNDLIDTTRIQADRLTLHLVPIDLVAHVRRCLNRLQVTTTRHTLTLDAPVDPVLLAADGLRLEQVLGNLISNAIKYSPQGGPIEVTVRGDQRTGMAELRIHDHGIGIPANEQVRLFQRFARAHNAYDLQIPGSGLGLYVCRALVERHGGHIWFESAEGEGTTFFLTLPLLSSSYREDEDQHIPSYEDPASA
jgi:PAS domain S-box-containing protein